MSAAKSRAAPASKAATKKVATKKPAAKSATKAAATPAKARKGIQAADAPRAVGHYPHARRVGDLLFLSGIGPRNPGDNRINGNVYDAEDRLISYDIDAQVRAVFHNVQAVLEASGARWEDLVDVTVYLTDMARDFKAYNAVWAEFFPDADRAPCRTTLGITALPTPIAIELKCTAVVAK
jgi:2-aminomuconate deaminase